MDSRMTSHDALLARWAAEIQARMPDATFAFDGIVSLEHWASAPRKVLFVLRETNDFPGSDVRAAIRRSAEKRTGWRRRFVLRRVGRWAHGLLNYNGEAPPLAEAIAAQFTAPLSVAYMNLKKTTGGAAINAGEMEDWVKTYAEHIRLQIAAIEPDLVVLGGTYRLLRKHVYPNLFRVAHRAHVAHGLPFINASHPAARLSNQHLYAQVVDTFRQAKPAWRAAGVRTLG